MQSLINVKRSHNFLKYNQDSYQRKIKKVWTQVTSYKLLIVCIVTVLAISALFSSAYAYQSDPNIATIKIFSNTMWNGTISNQLGNTTIKGDHQGQFSFKCGYNQSFNINLQKESHTGDMSVYLFQKDKLVKNDSTQKPYGLVVISGKCDGKQIHSYNNGMVWIHTDKKSYHKGDFIKITGTVTRKHKDSSQMTLTVLNPKGEISYTESKSFWMDNNYATQVRIDGTSFCEQGNYTIVAKYKSSIVERKILINATGSQKLTEQGCRTLPSSGIKYNSTNFTGLKKAENTNLMINYNLKGNKFFKRS